MAKTVIYQEDSARTLDVSPTDDGRVSVAIRDRNGNVTDWGVLTLDNWGKLCRALNQELELVAKIEPRHPEQEQEQENSVPPGENWGAYGRRLS